MRSRAAFLSALLWLGASARLAAQPSTNTLKAVAAANEFLATLTDAQRAVVHLELNRQNQSHWSNLPAAVGYTNLRNGIRMAELTPSQRNAVLKIVAAPLSDAGYRKVLQILMAEEVRMRFGAAAAEEPSLFDRGEFQFAILGEPSASRPWMIQLGGHHLGLNILVAGEVDVLTPLHTGTEPVAYTMNGKTVRPLGAETDKAFALMNALSAEQQKQAAINQPAGETVFGPGQDDKTIPPLGIRGSAMTPGQQKMLIDLIGEWVTILNDKDAAPKMAEARAGIADTWFAWSGPTRNGSAAYFRIQGPTVEIEYAPQDSSENHIHTFYRDPANDYGGKVRKL